MQKLNPVKFPDDIQIFLACGKIDMRKSIDELAAIVSQNFKLNPFENALFLFYAGKRQNESFTLGGGQILFTV